MEGRARPQSLPSSSCLGPHTRAAGAEHLSNLEVNNQPLPLPTAARRATTASTSASTSTRRCRSSRLASTGTPAPTPTACSTTARTSTASAPWTGATPRAPPRRPLVRTRGRGGCTAGWSGCIALDACRCFCLKTRLMTSQSRRAACLPHGLTGGTLPLPRASPPPPRRLHDQGHPAGSAGQARVLAAHRLAGPPARRHRHLALARHHVHREPRWAAGGRGGRRWAWPAGLAGSQLVAPQTLANAASLRAPPLQIPAPRCSTGPSPGSTRRRGTRTC